MNQSAHGITIFLQNASAGEILATLGRLVRLFVVNIAQIFVAGLPESVGAAPALRAQTGAEVRDLVSASQLSGGIGTIPKWRMAGVVGALLS